MGRPEPLISIVLPVRNAGETLQECLDSIRAQSLRDYELLIIDDDSDDGSLSLARRLGSSDNRILIFSNPGTGLVSALNHGLHQARASLVARMDADDRMHPQRLQRQYDHLRRHPQTTLLGCGSRPFPEHRIQAGLREYIRWQNGCTRPDQIRNEIYIESPFAHPTVIFRKQAILELGGYRQGPFPEDYDLWLRLHQAGRRMEKLPEILLDWRDYPTRTSRTDPRCSRQAFDRLRAHYLARDRRLLARRDELVFWGAGRKTRKRCSLLIQRGFEPRAWIDIDPRKIGNRIAGVPVESPSWLAHGKRAFVLVYVTNHGARDLIARDLRAMDYRPGRDYLMVG